MIRAARYYLALGWWYVTYPSMAAAQPDVELFRRAVRNWLARRPKRQ